VDHLARSSRCRCGRRDGQHRGLGLEPADRRALVAGHVDQGPWQRGRGPGGAPRSGEPEVEREPVAHSVHRTGRGYSDPP